MIKDALLAKEYADAQQLFEQMHRIRRALNTSRPSSPLTQSDLMMLASIDHMHSCKADAVTVGRLARTMHQTPAAVSQKIRVLEEQGYIKRTPNKADRRVTHLALTKKGSRVATQAMLHFMGHIQQVLNQMGPQKTHALLELLKELEATANTFAGGE